MRVLAQRATLAVSIGLLGACANDVAPSSVPTSSAQSPATVEAAGSWQPFTLYTHCGLGRTVIEFDGDLWEATGPGPLDDGAGNPPPGFGNPSDEGSIVRLDADRATYRSSEGVVLDLARLDERPDRGMCF